MRLVPTLAVALGGVSAVLATPLATQPLAPLSTTGQHIDDAYIVVFKKGVDKSQVALHLTAVEGFHLADVSIHPRLVRGRLTGSTRTTPSPASATHSAPILN